MTIQRRTLLRAGGALAASAVPLTLLFNRSARPAGEGQSTRTPLLRDPAGILDLPAGFTYAIIERAGALLSDGYRVPALPDGMACFAGPNQSWVLLRNHELERSRPQGAFEGAVPSEAYDRSALGCVSRVLVDSKSLQRISSNLVLAGTLRNCGGGPSPWGWLSCEESVATGHGYVFRCAPEADRLRPPEKISGYGRFNHEAVCVDPRTRIAYLTEDRVDGCLYRFVPRSAATPFDGKLEALRIRQQPRFETATQLRVGQRVAVDWCTIDEPDPREDSVRYQARQQGAASVRRGEGAWFQHNAVYVSATTGGRLGRGQILRLDLGSGARTDELTSVAESMDDDVLEGPDNITLAPWGDLYIAEDGGGEDCLRVLGKNGRIVTLARNALGSSEFAGVCFSPDASVLFVNIQQAGLTLAIRGPFQKLAS